MEEEIRFYYTLEDYENLLKKYKNNLELKYEGCFFERTLQYDHLDDKCSFYSKEIDGRFRIRTSKNILNDEAYAKISWKRRLNDENYDGIHREEEKEVNFDYSQYDNLIFLLEKVIKMKPIESYERYRNVFIGEGVEIVIDKFPFAVALEIEAKGNNENSADDVIKIWLQKLNLDIKDSYDLSWDDKYSEICKKRGEEPKKHVKFE